MSDDLLSGWSEDAALSKLNAPSWLQSVYDDAPYSLFIVAVSEDPAQFRFVSVNRTCVAVSGIAFAEWQGRTINEISAFSAQQAEAVYQRYRQCLEVGGPIEYEEHLILPSGEGWYSTILTPTRDADGRISYIIGRAFDITARVRRTQEAQRRHEEVRVEAHLEHLQNMAMIGRLVSSVAHDFNNLLMIISNYVTLLIDEATPGDMQHEALASIQLASNQGEHLTRQLLEISRGAQQPRTVLDATAVIAGIERLLQRVLPPAIRLTMNLATIPLPIQMIPGQLEQILLNLTINARDAMPHGGVLTVTVSVQQISVARPTVQGIMPQNQYVVISVRDSGIGMDAELQGRVFEPFFTTKALKGGTGVGLAIVADIVAESGGFIELVSTPQRGTTFYLYFPLTVSS